MNTAIANGTHSTRRGARYDLHLHSTISDGRYSPEEVLRRCADSGLEVVALTDHDLPASVWGDQRFEGRSLWVIAGCEVTGSHDGHEFHLLVYFQGPVPQAFQQFCLQQAKERSHRYSMAVERIGLAGLESADDAARRGERSLTRLHLAHALVESGYATSVADAFKRFLSRGHGKVPRFELQFTDAIRLARRLGGVTSWAHPPASLVGSYAPEFAAAGLQGIEGIRPFLTYRDRQRYRKVARKDGLFLTGGSDWHGWKGDDLGLFFVVRQDLDGFIRALSAA
jgi:3',5'-nucleoside bisphosphate phosphatase